MRHSETLLAPLLQWDKDVSYLCYRWYNAYIKNRLPLLILEVSGHGVPWLLIPVLLFLFKTNLSPIGASLMVNLFAITILDLAVIGLLKPCVGRPRPAYNSGIGHVTIHAVDQFSFPSGHATRAGSVAAFVWHVQRYHSEGLHSWVACEAFLVLTLIWAVGICASRVALGRHHVLDVVFGAMLGVSYIYLWELFWISPEFSDNLRRGLRHSVLGVARVAKVASTLETTI